MQRILISACLMGEPVRYDGSHRLVDHRRIAEWLADGRLVPFCPEVAGGLPTPRPAVEIVGGDGQQLLNVGSLARVVDVHGNDFTAQFVEGAYAALAAAKSSGCAYAVLMDGSPSCGSSFIYDGSFTGQRRPGVGITAAVLSQHGVRVFNPDALEELAEEIRRHPDR